MRFHPTPGPVAATGGPGLGGIENEYERFSQDRDWMPRVVLMAKRTYVWLDQLSKHYGRPIHRLDQIPDEELDILARRGFTGLWLIGLWERSRASQRIKQMARQSRSRGLGLLAVRLRDRRRPGRRRSLPEPARPLLGARHPPGQRHGAQPHGHRFALGDRASRLVHLAARLSPFPAYSLQRRRTCPTTSASGSRSKTTTRTRPMRRSSSSASTAGPATTPLHLPRQRRHQHALERHGAARLPERPRCARRSSRPSSTSRASSRSSASTPP